MYRLNAWRLLLAAVVLLLPGQPARADSILWDYSTTVFPTFSPTYTVVSTPSPYPWSPYSDGIWVYGTGGTMTGSSPLSLATWSAYAGLFLNGTATFQNAPVQIGIGIHDVASNGYQQAHFNAYLNGTLSDQVTGSTPNLGFNLAISYVEPSQTLQFGSTSYKIKPGAFNLSGMVFSNSSFGSSAPMHSWSGGSIDATVEVQENPEPSTLVLLGAGGTLAGLLYYRRQRARAAAIA